MSSVDSPSPAGLAPSARPPALRGLLDAVPIMLGFVPFALVLGAQAAQKGMSVVEVPLMTGLNFGAAPSLRRSRSGPLRRIFC
ncbi:hypothetical protein [Paracoccus cavernae]|uniref:hypothetical protein n=1 Tax=Paracoccus cavernae TaxID=1571207 RepID=UPI00364278AA